MFPRSPNTPHLSPSPSPSGASQSPCSPLETPKPPSNPPHPQDAFTVLRFSARLPLPTSSSDDDDDDNNDDDDDNNDNDDEDGKRNNGDNNDYDRPDRRGSSSGTRIQSLELCFHADFLASAALDDSPVSLHFSSSPGSILLYPVPPSLKPPTPPYYIHEIPNVIDLTRERGPALNPPRLSRRNTARYLCVIVVAALFVACGLLGSYTSIPDIPARPDSPRPTRPMVITSPAGRRYALSFTNESRSIALHRKVLSLQHHRVAFRQPLVEALNSLASLSGLESTISVLCRNAAVHLFVAEGLRETESAAEIDLLCEHLYHRLWNMCKQWIHLRNNDGFDVIPTNLGYAARLLQVSSPDNVWQSFRMAFFNSDHDPFVAACNFCESSTALNTFVEDSAVPLSPPVQQWHFACSTEFPQTTIDNTTAAFLLKWATAQSARRFNTLRNAPIDVDGQPLFPDNQHPFSEADEVVSSALPGEPFILALTRHLIEFAVSISSLLALLVEKGVVIPLPANATSPDGYVPCEARKPPRRKHPILRRSQELGAWLVGYKPQQPPPSDTEVAAAIADSASALLRIRNSTVIPAIRLLGQVAGGISGGCMLSADLLRDIDDLEHAGPTGFETTEASLRAPASPVMGVEATTTVELKHVVHTPDPGLEAEALSKAYRLMRGILKAQPSARKMLQINPSEREVKKATSRESRPIVPRNDKESAFMNGLRENGFVSAMKPLADVFQAFEKLVQDAAQDDSTPDWEE